MCPKYSILNEWEKPSLDSYCKNDVLGVSKLNKIGLIPVRISNRSATYYVQKHNYNNSSIGVIPVT